MQGMCKICADACVRAWKVGYDIAIEHWHHWQLRRVHAGMFVQPRRRVFALRKPEARTAPQRV